MADPWLQMMLTHIVNIYHLLQSAEVDGQLTNDYPGTWTPDILNLPCYVCTDGKMLAESAVGYAIESDAIMYCEAADIRERDRIHFGAQVFFVNGTPTRYRDPMSATPMIAHLLEVGLKEDKTAPA